MFWAHIWDNVFGIVTALRVGRFEVRIPAGTSDFSSRKLSDWTWGPPILLLNAYRMSPPSPKEVKQPSVEVDHLHSGPSLRKGGATHLLTLFAFIAFAKTSLPLLVPLAYLGLRVRTGCPLRTVL